MPFVNHQTSLICFVIRKVAYPGPRVSIPSCLTLSKAADDPLMLWPRTPCMTRRSTPHALFHPDCRPFVHVQRHGH